MKTILLKILATVIGIVGCLLLLPIAKLGLGALLVFAAIIIFVIAKVLGVFKK